MNSIEISKFLRYHLKMRHVLLLVALADHASILAAAQQLEIAQPAASKLLAELEHALGMTLFERHSRGITPNLYGEVLIRRARSMLYEMQAAEAEITALRKGTQGHVALGTISGPAAHNIPNACLAFNQRYPEIHLSIELDYSLPLIKRLLQRQLDIIVGRMLDSSSSEQLQFDVLGEENHLIIVGKTHPLARVKKAHLTLALLVQEAWILPPTGSFLRTRIETAFRVVGLHLPTNVIETADTRLVVQLLQHGQHLAALPPESIQMPQKLNLVQLPIDLDIQLEPYGIITRTDHALSPAATLFVATLKEHFQSNTVSAKSINLRK